MLQEMTPFFASLLFLLGAVVGSFLNVCIARLPSGKSVVFPSSHCPVCQKPIRWFDNIPLFSYCLLGAKCRDCKTRISIRYFLVEFLTALMFLGTFYLVGLAPILFPVLVLEGLLIVATFVDFEHRIIPDELSLWGIPAGILLSFLLPGLQLDRAMAGPVVGWAVSLLLVSFCALLMLSSAWMKRRSLSIEERRILLGGYGIVLLQYGVLFLASWDQARADAWSSLAASLEGGVIGGAALLALGLLGEVLIHKRIVTPFDLETITGEKDRLFKALQSAGYLDEGGEVQKKFSLLKKAQDLELPPEWGEIREKVYEAIVSCVDGGVMGGGDVKLMALVGVFIGWELALLAIIIAPFLGAPVGIIEKIRTKSSALAFGPYLAMGSLIAFFWGHQIIRSYMGLFPNL